MYEVNIYIYNKSKNVIHGTPAETKITTTIIIVMRDKERKRERESKRERERERERERKCGKIEAITGL